MVVVAVIRGVAAEDMNAVRRADPTMPVRGVSMLIIRIGNACSAWIPGKRILADIPRIVMAKARGARIKTAITTEPPSSPRVFLPGRYRKFHSTITGIMLNSSRA